MKSWFNMALLLANVIGAAESAAPSIIRPRVFVLTNISNEPDDEESPARFLVSANE
jgi:hypothetical protein